METTKYKPLNKSKLDRDIRAAKNNDKVAFDRLRENMAVYADHILDSYSFDAMTRTKATIAVMASFPKAVEDFDVNAGYRFDTYFSGRATAIIENNFSGGIAGG